MKTAVSLITSVLWPFLICNIAILKKDLTVSLLVIFFLVWVGCSLYLSVEFMLLYLVNAFVKISIRSSCLSFPHTDSFWLSRLIIESTWLSYVYACCDDIFFLLLFIGFHVNVFN